MMPFVRWRSNKHRRFLALCGLAVLPIRAAIADPPASANYRLVFADEFNGTSLDTSKWSAASPGWTMPNSNSTATASDVTVGGGLLTLNANRPTAAATFDSGSISSYNKYSFTGGYVEAKIQLPTTVGSWPAFWGLFNGWPPEADIMEYPLTTDGGTSGLANNKYSTNYHYTNSSNAAAAGAGVVSTGSNLATTSHIFGMDWVANTSMKFYLDGNLVQSYTGSTVSQMTYMYMILDYAVGGWPGAPSTAQWAPGHSDKTTVDWVRVWQSNTNAGTDAPSNWNISGGGAFATASNWTNGTPRFGNENAYFGRVGIASTAAISMAPWQVFGGITFDGLTSGTLAGTTAYTLGAAGNQIQLASTTGSVTVAATAASTASQTINAGIELWSNSNFRNDMTGGQTLNFNGNLSGAGTLNVDGAGTIILSGTGSYAGTTTIGTAAGPAVLRVNADSALSTGTVVIGTSGNLTTARLELIGGHSIPNAIDLRGRNTNTPAIENISGNNTISGLVTANLGGGNYQIQSDAGTLTLSGGLQVGASSARTITLQGAGNGLVSGKIQNGTAPVSLLAAGPGVWSLSNNNTYTGTTTISGGTLQLLGSAAPMAAYSFSPATVSDNTISNTGLGGSAMNAIFNASGGTGSISTTAGPIPGTGALLLNSTGSLLDVNSGVTSLSNSSSWTVSAWVKTTQAGFTLLNKGTTGSNWGNSNSTFYLGVQGQAGTAAGGVPVAVRYGGGWMSGTTNPPVNDGQWHLVTYTNNGSVETIYVDGTAETTTQGFTNGDIGNHLRIGNGALGEADGNAVSNGSIGPVNIYASALSAAQIQALYTSNIATVVTTNILPATTPVALTSASAVLDLEAVNQTVASLTGPAGSALILGYKSTLTISNATSSEFDGSVTGNGSINEPNAGTFTLGGATVAYTGSTTIGSNAIFNLAANSSSSNVLPRMIGAITVNANGKLNLAPATTTATRQLLITPSISLAGGTLNLANNDLIVQSTGSLGLTSITTQIKQGYANGTWQGSTGIVSSVAAANSSHLTTLGAMLNSNGAGGVLYSSFDGTAVGSQDVLVKYTYFGDANLDGRVDGSDYSLIDSGSINHLTGWFNGDFNYDGIVNGSDYTLIDNVYNTQGAVISNLIASPNAAVTSQIANVSTSVPEPGVMLVSALSILTLSRRRVRLCSGSNATPEVVTL